MVFRDRLSTSQVIISLRGLRLGVSEPREVRRSCRRLPVSYIFLAGSEGRTEAWSALDGIWMGSGWDLDPASGGRSLPAGALQTGSLPNSPRLAKQHSICSEVLGLRPKGRAASRGVFPRSPWKEHNPSLSLEQSGSNPSLAAQTPTHGWGGLSGLGEALRLAL